MLWSCVMHRKSRGVKPATFHENVKVEILDSRSISYLIGMAIPATQTLIAMEDTSEPDVSILVTGSKYGTTSTWK